MITFRIGSKKSLLSIIFLFLITAHVVAQDAPFSLSGNAALYTYVQNNLSFELTAHQNNIKIEDFKSTAPFFWLKGCKERVLKANEKCYFELGYPLQKNLPSLLEMTIKISGIDWTIPLELHKIDAPVLFSAYDQRTNEQQANTQKNLVFLPWSKIGSMGEGIGSTLQSQHFDKLTLKSIQSPPHLKISGCLNKRMAQGQDCEMTISYHPKTELDKDGVIIMTLADKKNTYRFDINVKARPWKPLLPKKILASESEVYMRLKDGSLWKTGHPWDLVDSSVDDFYVGPDSGLVVKKGDELWASQSSNYSRFGMKEYPKEKWSLLAQNAQAAYVSKDAIYYWDKSSQLWSMSQGSWSKISQNFSKLYQDDEALFGIDENHGLWFKGQYSQIGQNNIYESKSSASWQKIDSEIAQFESCGLAQIKLKTDGRLFTIGQNVVGQIGIPKLDSVKEWTLANSEVERFAIDCQRLSTTPSHQTLYVLKKDGSLWGHGGNNFGQLGLKESIVRSWQLLAKDVTAFTVKESVLIFIKKDGTLWASGAHSFDVSLRSFTPERGKFYQLGDFRYER